MLLRETLKRELDTLNESQLSRIAEHILSLKMQTQTKMRTAPFWESATPKERSQDFLEWVSQLLKLAPPCPMKHLTATVSTSNDDISSRYKHHSSF
jgi:transposase